MYTTSEIITPTFAARLTNPDVTMVMCMLLQEQKVAKKQEAEFSLSA